MYAIRSYYGGDMPAAHVFVGAAIVVTSGLVILWRESRKGVKI